MKKYLLLLPAIALLWTGCKKDGDEPQKPEIPEEVPEEQQTLKLVDKISWVGYEDGEEQEGATISFTYDASNRITKISQEYVDGEEREYTYSYSGNQVTCVENYSYEGNIDEIVTTVLTLDANGYAVSGTETIESIIHGEPDEDLQTNSWTVTYDNEGHVTKVLYEDDDSIDFTWSDGNLTKLTDSDEGRTEPWFTTVAYGSQANNPACNIDMNWICSQGELAAFALLPQSAPLLGFYGKSSDKLMTESTETWGISEDYKLAYTWELDSEGFVTKVTERRDMGSGFEVSSYMTITYKN